MIRSFDAKLHFGIFLVQRQSDNSTSHINLLCLPLKMTSFYDTLLGLLTKGVNFK